MKPMTWALMAVCASYLPAPPRVPRLHATHPIVAEIAGNNLIRNVLADNSRVIRYPEVIRLEA